MNAIIPSDESDRQLTVGATADKFARENNICRLPGALRRQLADLALFTNYLVQVKFYADVGFEALRLYSDPAAWSGITYGLVAGFVRWQLQNGYAIASINVRLSTVKQYAKLAFQAGALGAEPHALIRTITGYQFKEQKRVDEKRSAEGAATRVGAKKAESVKLTVVQVKALKTGAGYGAGAA